MASVVSAIRNTIPISVFNRGLAGKIFNDIKHTGAKVVIKNNVPEAVILSPDEYLQLIDEINDARLLTMAAERIAKFNPNELITQEEIDRKFGITEADLDGFEEVEFE